MALALFTVEITVIKLLSGDHPIAQLVLWRSASQLLLMLPLMLRGRGHVFATDRPWLHLARGGLSGAGMFTFYFAFSALPLAFATAISFTQPLFLVLLAVLMLGEKVTRRRLVATIVGFSGAILVIRPGAVPLEPATLVAVLGAVVGALLLIVTKRLAQSDGTMTIMAWVSVTTSMHFLVPGAALWTAPRLEDAWLFALLSLGGPIGQFLLINAFRMADASALAPIDFTRLILAGIAGYLVFREVPDPWTLVGSAVIAGSTILASRPEPLLCPPPRRVSRR